MMQATLNHALDRAEGHWLDGSERPLPFAPIFILGAPRSGSTLLYQVLVDAFDVGYPTNAHRLLFGSPALVQRIARLRRSARKEAYTSSFGRTEGLWGPNEMGEFWYRFFARRPHLAEREDVAPAALRRLRGSVRAFTEACGKPVVFKNLYCSLRIEPLAIALPEALFIVCRRSIVDIAHSLLEARKQLHGDYTTWFSLEPPGIEELRTHPPEVQVVEQARRVYTYIDGKRESIGAQRFFDVEYEHLCADPELTLSAIARFLDSRGTVVARRAPAPPPFHAREAVRIEPNLHRRLVTYASSP